MLTSSNVNTFSVTGPLCGEFTGRQWIPLTKASDAGLWFFLWSAPEKPLSKRSRRWWFDTPLHSLWRHCNVQKEVTQDWATGYIANNISCCWSYLITGNMLLPIWQLTGKIFTSEQYVLYHETDCSAQYAVVNHIKAFWKNWENTNNYLIISQNYNQFFY